MWTPRGHAIVSVLSERHISERLCEPAMASKARITSEELDLVNRFKELSTLVLGTTNILF